MAEKITVAEKFAATIAILEGTEPAIDFTVADAIAFIADRAEKAKGKPRAHQTKPEVTEFRAAVATYMAEVGTEVTAKEAGEALGVSVQKASAALRYLAGEGVLTVIEGEKAKDAKRYVLA